MRKKEFVPYEVALELKELGFDEECLAWFAETKGIQIAPETYKKWTSKPCNNSNIVKVFNVDCITAPTFSQAFRWFREKYKYDITIPPTGDSNGNTIGYYYEIIFQGWDDGIESESYDTYEEAELECLIKLIEVVKSKQN